MGILYEQEQESEKVMNEKIKIELYILLHQPVKGFRIIPHPRQVLCNAPAHGTSKDGHW
jgi:hypothetical protein